MQKYRHILTQIIIIVNPGELLKFFLENSIFSEEKKNIAVNEKIPGEMSHSHESCITFSEIIFLT